MIHPITQIEKVLAFNKSDFRFRRKHRRKEQGKSEVWHSRMNQRI